jgi:hypothetical protein
MTAFTDLLANVYTLTNRPDLVAETTLAIKAATLKLHRLDYFAKDLYEVELTFPTSSYFQTLVYASTVPLFRTAKYLRKYDAVGLTAGKELKAVPIEKVLDSYGIDRVDVYYLAGTAIQIRSSTQEQYFLFGCYLSPNVDTVNYASWIYNEYPYAIVYSAASIVLSAIHQDELAAKMDKLAAVEIAEIIASNLETIGS